MNDVTISGRRLRCEAVTAGVCVLLAVLVNAYAIVAYKTSWSELYTAWRMTLAVAGVAYVGWSVLRLLTFSIRCLLKR